MVKLNIFNIWFDTEDDKIEIQFIFTGVVCRQFWSNWPESFWNTTNTFKKKKKNRDCGGMNIHTSSSLKKLSFVWSMSVCSIQDNWIQFNI